VKKDDRAKHEGLSTNITQQTYSNSYQQECRRHASGLSLRELEETLAPTYRQL